MCREVSSSSPAVWPASLRTIIPPASAVIRSSFADWLQDVNELHQAIHKQSGGIWVRPMPSLSRAKASHMGSQNFIGGYGSWVRAM